MANVILLTSVRHNLSNKWIPLIYQIRGSKYGPEYVEPTYTHKELDKLYEDGIAQERAYKPVKAARSNETSSVFRDPLLEKFINTLMRKGNKELARSLVEKGFENIKRMQLEKYYKASPEERRNIELNPLKLFHTAITNSKPVIHVIGIKRGGKTYQVPMPISDFHSRFRAMKWLIEASKDKFRRIHFPEKFAIEVLDAANNEGQVIKRKQDLHRQCEANRAYAHYRWR